MVNYDINIVRLMIAYVWFALVSCITLLIMTHNQFFFFPFMYAVLLYIYDKCTIFCVFNGCMVLRCSMLVLSRYMGTITGISDLDPVRWPNSHWRSVKVIKHSTTIAIASDNLLMVPFLTLYNGVVQSTSGVVFDVWVRTCIISKW